MKDVKVLRIAMSIAIAVSLLALNAGYISAADTLVDQTAKIDLKATMHAPAGAMGTVELRLRIDEAGIVDSFRAKVDAEGLLPGVTYSLFIMHVISTAVADGNGKVSFDVRVEGVKAHRDTLIGLKVKIIEGTSTDGKVVLCGKVMSIEE